LAKKPGDATIFYHLALAYRSAGEPKETRKALIKALELDPAMAQGWCALAMLDAESGNLASAAGLFRRAIAANRNYAAAYDGLARVLAQSGKPSESLAAMEHARRIASPEAAASGPDSASPSSVADLQRHLTPTPQQAQIHFAMAAWMNLFPPAQTPAEAVTELFDRYAPKFDHHLVETLDYHIPEKLVAAVSSFCQGKLLDALDAGCGTGLAAPLLRPISRTLTGVDLSSAMIEKARERGLYDRLEVGDLVESLRSTPAAYDLLVCADVLIYLGEAAPFFEAAAFALRPGGLLAFSVEACPGDRYELVPRSRRFTHSKPYIQRLAAIYGFTEKVFQTTVVRKELDQPVNGHLVVLSAPAG
jgi:predicted TPR repeat methyltransferase